MKVFRKTLSVILALVMTALMFAAPVNAWESVYPLVIINGFASTTLYQDVGTEDEKAVFLPSEEDTQTIIADVLGSFVTGFISFGVSGAGEWVNRNDWNKLADQVIPTANKYIDPFAYNPDGTPKYDNIGIKPTDKALSECTEEESEQFFVFGQEYAEQNGAEYVYNFSYDWRRSPIDVAADLDAFIDNVLAETGKSKTNVVAISMGSCITLAYISEFGSDKLNNVVFASPAWQGTSLAGNVFTGNIEFDIFAVENFLVMAANESFATHYAAFITSWIASYEGLSHEYFGKINYVVQQLLPRIYNETIIPLLAGMPGLWSLVPADYYEDAKAFLFPDGMDADFEAKIDAYNAIQKDAKNIIQEAMDNDMHFGIVCGYSCQMIPVNEEYVQSDTVVDTVYASGGANCALYLQAFDDWGNIYVQAKPDGHNHVSWDRKVDASTCMFPEQVWFIRNMQHMGYVTDYGTTDTVMWLLDAPDQVNVFTDEDYPQFSLFNTYTKETKGVPSGGILGDIDQDTIVSTDDARIALEVTAGITDIDEVQFVLGDVDENGYIDTDDARAILCMAVGIKIQ